VFSSPYYCHVLRTIFVSVPLNANKLLLPAEKCQDCLPENLRDMITKLIYKTTFQFWGTKNNYFSFVFIKRNIFDNNFH